jgi:histidinol dehydrogenase
MGCLGLFVSGRTEERALAVLVTTSEKLAREVNEYIEEDIKSGRGRHEIKKTSIQNAIIF